MKIKNKSTKIIGAVSGAAVTTALFTTSVFASPATLSRAHTAYSWSHNNATSTSTFASSSRPILFGNVANINGTTITIHRLRFSRDGSGTATATYTVNAANATVLKSGATTTLASIALGDRILVQGTMVGTVINATTIRDLGANATSTTNKHTPNPNPANRGKHLGWNNNQKHAAFTTSNTH